MKAVCPTCNGNNKQQCLTCNSYENSVSHPQAKPLSPTVNYHMVSNPTAMQAAQERLPDLDGGLRPILSGIFIAMKMGVPVPHAKVTVTYHGTDNLVALFLDQDKRSLMPNPAITDENGMLPIYYKGGAIDILVERVDSSGCVCEVVQKIFNSGGYVDSDSFLGDERVGSCIDIEKPLIRIYDQDKQNRPSVLLTPQQVNNWGNWKSGAPIGTYSQTVSFFECIGEPFSCGVTVYGDTDGIRYRYDCENCNDACPPDPETQVFTEDGVSECWTRRDQFNACDYPEVPFDNKILGLGCLEGNTVRYPVTSGFTSIAPITEISDSSITSDALQTGTLSSVPPNSVALVASAITRSRVVDDEFRLFIRYRGSTVNTAVLGGDVASNSDNAVNNISPQQHIGSFLVPVDENGQFQYSISPVGSSGNQVTFTVLGFFQ